MRKGLAIVIATGLLGLFSLGAGSASADPPTICPADHILTPAELVQNGAKKDHNRNRLLCGKPKNDGPDKDLDLFNGGPDEDVDVADIIDDLG